MKSRFFLACTVFCIGALLLAITTNSQHLGREKNSAFTTDGQPHKVSLPCTSGGGMAGTVKIDNKGAEAIPANTVIYLANFGGKITVQLAESIPAGASKQVPGPPGAFKTCQAWFYKQPGN